MNLKNISIIVITGNRSKLESDKIIFLENESRWSDNV